MQVIKRVLISLCMFFFGFISSVYANHQGYDCSVCHDSVETRNLYRVREVISTPNSGPKEVWFTAYTGWHSFADGDTVYDGVCEVCHTNTSYHKNDGTSMEHYDGENCIACHPHENDFYPTSVGNQSHYTHFDDPKGPQLAYNSCTYNLGGCHNPGSFSLFGPDPGQPLSATDVCDTCHSPDGAFDGVDDPDIGAKANWDNGIYEPAVPPEEWPSRLKAGKENWCAGCHDDDGTSVIIGVSAPNVMGDNTLYGYNVNGHGSRGVTCSDATGCHDTTAIHTDGQARTYSASSNNYIEGYRLNYDMAIPRNGEYGPTAFALCFNCHIYSYVMGPESNFRDDDIGQLHEKHLGSSFASEIAFDSDFDGIADSAISCTACHNIHGSPTPAMIRHGELISTPGTSDKVPALDFHWYEADGVTPTMIFGDSRWGGIKCSNSDISFNHVCWGCHTTTGEVRYYRVALLPTMTLLSPNGGELIPSGSTYTIQWGGPPEAVKFQIGYSLENGAGGTWNLIANNITDYSYNWTVPALDRNNNTCRVGVRAYNASGGVIGNDISDNPFTIEVVKVTTPNGGETLTSGTTYQITWQTNATVRPVQSVKIYGSPNQGQSGTWKLLTTVPGNPGYYDWTVPTVGTPKDKCMIGIRLLDSSSTNIGQDGSDNNFTIQPAP